MSAVAALREPDGVLEPGGETSCEISVLNTGTIVDQFAIDVLGAPGAWATVEPPVLSLFPNTQQVATIRFRPPLSHDVAPGPTPFAVRVVPTNSPDHHVTEEGMIVLAPFKDVTAELIPQQCEGRYRGRMHIAADSRGNFPFSVSVLASDPAAALLFRPSPAVMELRPNQATFSKLRILPRQHHIRGGIKQQRFSVVLDDNGTPIATLTGTYNQPPVVAKWLIALLIILIGLLIWLLLLRPAIRNTATDAATSALNQTKGQTAAATAQAKEAQKSAAAAAKKAEAATKKADALAAKEAKAAAGLAKQLTALKKAQTDVKTAETAAKQAIIKINQTVAKLVTTTLPPASQPFAKYLEAQVSPGTLSDVDYQVPTGDTYSITDLVIGSLASSFSSSSGTNQTGEVRVQLHIPGQSSSQNQNLLAVSLPQLNTVPFETARFDTPLVFSSGDQIVLSVQCGPNQAVCDVTLTASGGLIKPNPTTTSAATTTTVKSSSTSTT